MVEVGEVVKVRDWYDDVITVRVTKLFESPTYGPCLDGTEVENKHAVSLPISHVIQVARVSDAGWGKWNIAWPSGDTEEFRGSKKAAREYIESVGHVYAEE